MLMIHVQWSMQLVHVTCGCSCDSGWDTLLARNACSYIEKHLSTAVMSASSILLVYLSSYPNPTSHPSSKTHMFEDSTRAEVIAVDCPTVFCSCCYRRFMANTSEMNKWSSVSRNDKIQKLREAKGPTLSQNWYHVHQFALMIDWALFQCQTPHDDLIGLWWSFAAGNVFESKLSVSARNGEQSFWIWSPHNRERFGQNPPTPVSMQNGGTRSASTGREPPFYADKTHGRWGSYLVSYGIVGPFWFPPVVWVFVHPVGRTKSDKSLIPMWAAPAAEWCFEYINGISTWSTIIKKHFPWIQNWRWYNDCVLGDNSSCLLWVNATILDRQSLVSSTTQDVEIHLLNMKMHQRTRLTTLKDRKRHTVFVLSWWQLTKWIIGSSPLPKCQQVSTKRRKWKKHTSPDHLRWNFLGQVAKLHQDL